MWSTLNDTPQFLTDSKPMADISNLLEAGQRDMPLVEHCWLMWAHSVWMWIQAAAGRTMMWAVMRITAPTMQLFIQPKEFITLEAKKTGAWLTTSCSSTLVSPQCLVWSDWHNHYFLRKTSVGWWSSLDSCSFTILNTSCTKLRVPNMIIHMIILKQEVLPKCGNFIKMNGLHCPSWDRSVLKEKCAVVHATISVT